MIWAFHLSLVIIINVVSTDHRKKNDIDTRTWERQYEQALPTMMMMIMMKTMVIVAIIM